MGDLPDYYAVLEVDSTATFEDIKRAYKKGALKWHPDRVPTDSPERAKRTKMFQRINDAYYTLCDATRRRDYDEARRFHGTTGAQGFDADGDEDADEEIPRPRPSTAGPSWANMFGFGGGGRGQAGGPSADDQFQGAFEEMMEEEDMADRDGSTRVPNRRFWTIAGGISGAVIGFIVGDVVGAIPGFAAGSKLGAIRDAKGKSVYSVFQGLEQDQKARILSELAAKLFSGAIS